MPTKTWVVGEEVLAADFNSYVQRQVVATFPNAAARNAALPAPTVGMVVHVADTGQLQIATTTTPTGWRRIFPAASSQGSHHVRGVTDAFNATGWVNAGMNRTFTPGQGVAVQVTAMLLLKFNTGGGELWGRLWLNGVQTNVAIETRGGVNQWATMTMPAVAVGDGAGNVVVVVEVQSIGGQGSIDLSSTLSGFWTPSLSAAV